MDASVTAGPDETSPSPAPDRVAVLAQFIAKPGREADVCDALLHLVGPSRADPGNLSYDLHRLKNNPAAFYLLANWADQSALDQHMASAHVRTCCASRLCQSWWLRPWCAPRGYFPARTPDRTVRGRPRTPAPK